MESRIIQGLEPGQLAEGVATYTVGKDDVGGARVKVRTRKKLTTGHIMSERQTVDLSIRQLKSGVKRAMRIAVSL